MRALVPASGGIARDGPPRRVLALYFLAIVGPTFVLLVLGLQGVARQREAISRLSDANRRLREATLADRVEQRIRVAAERCLLDPEFRQVAVVTDWHALQSVHVARKSLDRMAARHPVARNLFIVEASEVRYPRTEPALPRSLESFTVAEPSHLARRLTRELARADVLEIQRAYAEAESVYLAIAARATTTPVRALARAGAARAADALGRTSDAARWYIQLATSDRDQFDTTGRPIPLVAAAALTAMKGGHDEHAAALDAVRGDLSAGYWELTVEEARYFSRALLANSPLHTQFADRLAFGAALREGFKLPAASLAPRRIYSSVLSMPNEERQLFLAAAAADGNGRLVVGLAVAPDWVANVALPSAARELGLPAGTRIVTERDGIGTALPSVLTWLRVALPAARGYSGWMEPGLILFSATTLAVLGVLVLGVVLLLRDVSRQASTSQLRADLVGGVSHELKTPLSVIRIYAETLADEAEQTVAERRSYCEVIIQESQRLSNLIERVLDFSRVDRGDRPYQLRPVRLGPIVCGVVERYGTFLRQQGFAVRTAIEDVPEVLADGEAVAQAIVNLLENAVNFSSDDRFLAVRVWSNERSVVIEMEDHGLGIPPEHREHVFGRFYRAGSRTGRGGYGLGLYLVKHLMEAHSGRAEVTSEVGKGSTFALVFPRAPAVDAAGVA